MESIAVQIVLFLSTFLIGSLFLFVEFKKEKSIKILLSFSGAFLFGLTVLHFIPELFNSGYNINYGIFILLGFCIQVFLEFFTGGLDHGHYHKGHGTKIKISALIGLFLHALFEATPLAEHSGHDHNHFHNYFLWGLVLHKIPIAIVFGGMLKYYVGRTSKSFLILGAFSLMAPLGLLLSEEIEFLSQVHDYFMALVIGIFLYISTTILFEMSENHKFNFVKLISIVIGFLASVAITVL